MATTLQKAFMRVIIETERNEQDANTKIEKHNATIQKIINDAKSASPKKKEQYSSEAVVLLAKIAKLKEAIAEAKEQLPLAKSHISTLSEPEQKALREEVLRDVAKASSPAFAAIEAAFELNTPGSSPSSSPKWLQPQPRQVSAPDLTEKTGLLKRISL